MKSALHDGKAFEEEVRRIARHRWPAAAGGGAEMDIGQERDGVFETEDCLHLLETTVSRSRDKALGDMKKLFTLYEKKRKERPEMAIKCWFITLDEPTGDQRSARSQIKGAPHNLFNIVSFATFQAALVDAAHYIELRVRHPFGSIYDPVSGNPMGEVPFTEAGISVRNDPGVQHIGQLIEPLSKGSRYVLLGEFGVGKSMTLREIYRKLVRRFIGHHSVTFPLYLNLREHHGQSDPAEILERHARSIGFSHPSQLVRAWKAGYLTLLIDGFDEVASTGLQGAWRRLRDARRASMTGVRKLVQNSPVSCGIVIAGRDNFFDTEEERKTALGQTSEWGELRLDEFTEAQLEEFTRAAGYEGIIPAWVPARPLFLATLFGRYVRTGTNAAILVSDPAEGWNHLLTEVCNREARIEHGVSGENVRRILEALATLAREHEGGLGPLFPTQILQIFQSECGFAAADEALIVLQRLPGLGRHAGSEDARSFVDQEFADACRAGDLVRFALNPYEEELGERLRLAVSAIGETGLRVCTYLLQQANFNDGLLVSLARTLKGNLEFSATAADAVGIALRSGIPIREKMYISNLVISHFEIDGFRKDLTQIHYTDCYFREIELAPEASPEACPSFTQCFIERLEGRVSKDDLPMSRFHECVIEEYGGSTATVTSILQLDIADSVKVLVTVLKKLFVQSLSGRRENAFYRGIGPELQKYVSPVLEEVAVHGLAIKSGRAGEPLWLPVRRKRARVLRIVSSPSTSTDSVVSSVKLLK